MPYCPRCGIKLPEEKGIRFCPNCGATIPHSIIKTRKIAWTGTLQQRIMVFLVVFLLCIAATVTGALVKIDPSDAENIIQEMRDIEKVTKIAGIQVIFGNNLMHTLIMFIPVFGPGWGFYVLFSTGRVFAAVSAITNINTLLTLLSLFTFPFTWMEYISYAIAISESLWITYAIIKRNFRNELTVIFTAIVLCTILLLLGALIETALILSYA